MGNTSSQLERPDPLGQDEHGHEDYDSDQKRDRDHDRDHDHDHDVKLREYIGQGSDDDSDPADANTNSNSNSNSNSNLKPDSYNLNPSNFAFSSQVQGPGANSPWGHLPHRRQHHQRRISRLGPKPDYDAADDASSLDEQPNSSLNSPVLKFEPPEPAGSPSPPPASDSGSHSDISAQRSASQRPSLPQAKPDPYLPPRSNDNEEDDAGQEQMYPTAQITGKLSKREKKERRRQKKLEAVWNATQTREQNSDGGDDGDDRRDRDDGDSHVASTFDSSVPHLDTLPQETDSPAKSSKKRKRKSSQRDELGVHATGAELSDPSAMPPPASKKRKSKGKAKAVRKSQRDTPDEMQDDQIDRELHSDVDMHADQAPADDPDSTGNSFENLAQSIYDDHLRSKNDSADQPPPSPTSPTSDDEAHADIDPAQEESSATKRHPIQSDILSKDITSDTSGFKNNAHSTNDDTSVVDSTPSSESSSDDEAAEPQRSSDSATALGTNRRSNKSGQAVEEDNDNSSAGEHHSKEHATPDGDLDDEVEVPSSVPIQNDRLAFTAPTRRTRPKPSTALHKSTSHSSTAKASGLASGDIASPAAAAASRKQGRQAVTESPAPATKPKPKQRRITSMLGDASSTPARPSSTPVKTPGKTSTIVKGAFSQFELDAIDQAIARWQEDHGLTKYQVNELVQGDPRTVNSTDFWEIVHATCPNRARQKVINISRRRHHNFVARGSWTTEQSEELEQMFELHGPKHTLIAKLINRHPEDVRDRYRNYVVCGDKRLKSTWTRQEEEHLTLIVNYALDAVRESQRIGEADADANPEDLVDWQGISRQMGRTRSRQQCKGKWRTLQFQRGESGIDGIHFSSMEELVEKARIEAGTMTDRDRYGLLKAIRTTKVQADSRIPWARIRRDNFKGQWSRPALLVAWNRLGRLSEQWRTLSVGDLSKELCRLYRSTKSLEYPNLTDAELGAEFQKIKYYVNSRIMRGLADREERVVDNSDDDEETNGKPEEEAEVEDDSESGDVAIQDASRNGERVGSVDLGFGENNVANGTSEDESSEEEISDSEPERAPERKQPGSSGTGRGVARNNGTDSLPSGLTPDSGRKSSSKTKVGAAEDAASVSSARKLLARRKARKGFTYSASKRAKRPARDDSASESEAQSSDTNASEAESIPAR